MAAYRHIDTHTYVPTHDHMHASMHACAHVQTHVAHVRVRTRHPRATHAHARERTPIWLVRYIAIINLTSSVHKVLNVTKMAFIDKKLHFAVHNYVWAHVIR